ncbi:MULTISPECIES: FAD-dependent oxidoreductase [unclassified Mesorhizobium]|uniref:FAD-dependent oxidoreductase n=1 Tax=unclassified Mesorhizobium TaxID=325217 RepID=UPI001FDF3F68|nr:MULTISPECIES: FAD-dependent oxidoreductase [unclassified Mesorhizobium]
MACLEGRRRYCDHWRRLAYAAAHPGCSEARATLLQAVAEKIFFAGEHVAGPLIQTCGGATLSGESVARRGVALLATK